MKSNSVVKGIKYNWEVSSMKPVDGRYRFGLQIWGNGQIKPYVMWLSEETIEDDLDPKKDLEFLEKLAIKVVETHLEDILNLNEGTVARNLKWWFREAKNQLEQEHQNNEDEQN